jgi:hypothetical protein
MADKCSRVFVRILRSLQGHRRSRQLDRFANSNMTGLTAVHDIRIGNIDLLNGGRQLFGFLLQSGDLGRREVHHVIADVLIHGRLGLRNRLERVA